MLRKQRVAFATKMHESQKIAMRVKIVCAATLLATSAYATEMKSVSNNYVDGDFVIKENTDLVPSIDTGEESKEFRVGGVVAKGQDTTLTIQNGALLSIKGDADAISSETGTLPTRLYAIASENVHELTINGNVSVNVEGSSQRLAVVRANGGDVSFENGSLKGSTVSETGEAYGADVWTGAVFDFDGKELDLSAKSSSSNAFGINVNGSSVKINTDLAQLSATSELGSAAALKIDGGGNNNYIAKC